ncbi:unnamed protein product, partial [Amoebophrya sp. A25]
YAAKFAGFTVSKVRFYATWRRVDFGRRMFFEKSRLCRAPQSGSKTRRRGKNHNRYRDAYMQDVLSTINIGGKAAGVGDKAAGSG